MGFGHGTSGKMDEYIKNWVGGCAGMVLALFALVAVAISIILAIRYFSGF